MSKTTTVVSSAASLLGRQAIPGKGPRAGDGTWLEDDDTYYYRLNRKNMRYYCEHERHLLRRNLYSKRELDIFFEELYMYDQPKSYKICGLIYLVIGFFLILAGFALWVWSWKYMTDVSDGWKMLWYVIAAILIIVGMLLCCWGCYDLYRRAKNKDVRRTRLTPIINDENYRIAHRGINWQLHDEHLALRTNYWNPHLKKRSAKITTTTKRTSPRVSRPMSVMTVSKPVPVVTTVVQRPETVVQTTTVTKKAVPVVQNSYVTTESVVTNTGGRYKNTLL
jgi:hypothetical protein